MAVADGLGSARFGRHAAAFAVRLAVHPLRTMLQAGLAPSAVPALFERLWSAEVGTDPAWATTLLFAVRTSSAVVVGQVGDGLVLACPPGGEPSRLPTGRGAWGNETAALPRDHLVVRAFPRDTVVLLATDGVSDDLVPGSEADLARHLLELGQGQGQDALHDQVSAWLAAWRTPGATDDRSLALLPGARS